MQTLHRRPWRADTVGSSRILAMLRASFPLVRAAVVIGGLLALQGAVAGDRDGDRRVTNTFVYVPAAGAKPAPTPRPSPNGTGLPPSKPVVSNPYQVPLLQNAGTLRVR